MYIQIQPTTVIHIVCAFKYHFLKGGLIAFCPGLNPAGAGEDVASDLEFIRVGTPVSLRILIMNSFWLCFGDDSNVLLMHFYLSCKARR